MRILVVDDDPTFRWRLVGALEARGMQAWGAGSPQQAKELASEVRPARAVVDLKMPGGSGLELVSELIGIDPAMSIVVLTGYGSIATALEATRRGAVDYLTKPADADQILAAFEKIGRKTESGAAGEELTSAPSLERVEWEHIQRVLMDCGGNVSQAARILGMHRRSLQRRLGRVPPRE